MNNKNLLYILFACLIMGTVGVIKISKSKSCKLIPRDVLFGITDKKIYPRLSRDGAYIVYNAPLDNVMNLWLKTFGEDDDRPITFDTNRGISWYMWSKDCKRIFYRQDVDGDENWRLYSIDITNATIREYPSFENTQTNIVDQSKHFPHKMLLSINKRDPKFYDIYEFNPETNELTLRIESDENVDWVVDKNMVIRGKLVFTSEGEYVLWLRKNEDSLWQEAGHWTVSPDIEFFSYDGNYLYLFDNRNGTTSRLVKMNTETFEIEEIASDPNYDISGLLLYDYISYDLLALDYTRDRSTWIFFDHAVKELFEEFKTFDEGEIEFEGLSSDRKKWLISFVKDNGPVSYWSYDQVTKTKKFLFDHQPILNNYSLMHMEPIEFKARDGLTIHGYITYPCGNKKTNVPLVLVVHGGPWARDTWGFDAEAQWLANRGYAVLQINFRGSTGYGKCFMQAGFKQYGGTMQDDLTDAIAWAIKEGIADPKKVAIYGVSYGGYAALAGATFTPDLYCCAVDVVGPSNLITTMKTIPPYWTTQAWYAMVGNPYTEEDFLRSISPLFFVDAIKIPILIAHGANDPRIKQAESEQIVEAMKQKGLEYDYLLFPDEGHGFVKPENRLKFYKIAEKFLAKYLGGRYEA
jgi:dipeptidyl aminopeptidase/acylaminoacyl peptidase